MSDPIPKYWKATLNRRGDPYARTRMVGVVAMGVAEAVEAISRAEPEAIIVSIVHIGPVNVTDDKALRPTG